MATSYKNSSRTLAHSIVPKSRTKKPISRPLPSTITNNSKGMKTRVEHNPSRKSMFPTSSILKKKPLTRRYTERPIGNVMDWPEPSDLEHVKTRRFYSPINTPPRLRTLITPPGIEPYRNHQNLRRVGSPLPGLSDFHSAPSNLQSWGVDPSDYRYHSTLNLMRRYPSPLSRYGLGSSFNRQMKPYIVVPRLTSFISPPVSSGGADFTLPSRRLSPIYVPDTRYTYLNRFDSFPSARFHREPSDYVYVRKNEAFANNYIEEFIGRSIEDQFVPDILLEIIGELEQESKGRTGKFPQRTFERHYTDLNQRIRRGETADTNLFSDEWMRELDHQPPSGALQSNSRLRYEDLPPDVQGRLLADINQERMDFEAQQRLTALSTEPLSSRTAHVSVRNDLRRDVQTENIREIRYDTHNVQKQRINQNQYNLVEQYAQNKLLDSICLDQLIRRYVKQTGSVADVDDLARLLDANILGNLVGQYQTIDESRSRTLDNYGSRKFHLNTFMNMTMDLLLSELSANLLEDMKDLDAYERKTLSLIALA